MCWGNIRLSSMPTATPMKVIANILNSVKIYSFLKLSSIIAIIKLMNTK